MAQVRRLDAADAAAFFTFLEAHLDSSLILMSNAEAAGLDDRGQPLQGSYFACFDGGRITAVAAHFWNGVLIVQGDSGLEDVARRAVAHTARPLAGIMGPLALVERVRRAVGADARRACKDDPEILYALEVEALRVPSVLAATGITVRAPTDEELAGVLVDWRMAYNVEVIGDKPSPTLRDASREQMSRMGRLGWVLCENGRPVSFSTFNAVTRGVVQVGGVFTPPEVRGRGYARGVVAHSLLNARSSGHRRSVLFTGRANLAAQRAYESLGYHPIGDFGLILFGS